jgi:hypothetical protein
MSCHFVVLLIKMFHDFYPVLEVPLYLTGSESCEIFFSRIGGMQGMERAYNFHELINCANALNQLSAVEYGENGLQFGQAHNKQKNVWVDLYPLQEGEDIANLVDFSGLATNEDIIGALKEGFKEAQALIRVLNMAPSTIARYKKWFIEPWIEEANDPKFGFTYKPSKELVAGEDGDAEVMRAALEIGVDLDEGDVGHPAGEGDVDDGVDPRVLFENEARDIISDMRSGVQCPNDGVGAGTSVPTVLYCPTASMLGKVVYKSTLVNELNGNSFLSKDRLTCICNSIYFNNSKDYLSTATSNSTCLLGLGSDCGVFFVESQSRAMGSAAKAAKSRSRMGRLGGPSSVPVVASSGTWCLGRIQKMRHKVGSRWRISQQPVDLLNRGGGTSNSHGSTQIHVLLNWFSKARVNLKFKYDVNDSQWIDVDSIISTVTLSYCSLSAIYTLDQNDANFLNLFVQS